MRSPSQSHQPIEHVNASYRQLRRDHAAREQRWKVEEGRRGLTGAWLALTAPPPVDLSASLAERERLRKAELSAYVLFGVLLMGLALIPNGLANRETLISCGVIIGAAVVAGALNRADHTMAAALLLIGAFSVALGSALVLTPTLDLMWLPALDFFAVPVLLAGLLLSRRAPFAVAGLAAAAVVALLELKPRDAGLAHMMAQLGIYHFMVRPITLVIVVAVASWLWARSVEQAIARADRAEEIAAMEHVLAEQKRQMERGIQGLLETHVRVANGDFSARAATGQENVLWQIAVSLNNLLGRLGKLAHVDQRLQRTEAEIERLAAALEGRRAGHGAPLPAPSGTRVDQLLRVIAGAQPRLPAPGAPASPHSSPAQPAKSPSASQVPEGVPGGKVPMWDGSGLTPMTGAWRAVSGHYSTARDPLGDYGSPLPHYPAGTGQRDVPDHAWGSQPTPTTDVNRRVSERSPLAGASHNDALKRDTLGSSHPLRGEPRASFQSPGARGETSPTLPHAVPPAPASDGPWPDQTLPPLPPSPWTTPARSTGSPAGANWRIAREEEYSSEDSHVGASDEPASPASDPREAPAWLMPSPYGWKENNQANTARSAPQEGTPLADRIAASDIRPDASPEPDWPDWPDWPTADLRPRSAEAE